MMPSKARSDGAQHEAAHPPKGETHPFVPKLFPAHRDTEELLSYAHPLNAPEAAKTVDEVAKSHPINRPEEFVPSDSEEKESEEATK